MYSFQCRIQLQNTVQNTNRRLFQRYSAQELVHILATCIRHSCTVYTRAKCTVQVYIELRSPFYLRRGTLLIIAFPLQWCQQVDINDERSSGRQVGIICRLFFFFECRCERQHLSHITFLSLYILSFQLKRHTQKQQDGHSMLAVGISSV